MSVAQVSFRLSSHFQAFKAANPKRSKVPKQIWKWQLPSEGTLKLNVDSAFDGLAGSWGVVVRGSEGRVVVAGACDREGGGRLLFKAVRQACEMVQACSRSVVSSYD